MLLLKNGHEQLAGELLKESSTQNLDVQSNNDGSTLLMLACEAGAEEIVRLCLEKRCSVTLRDHLGDTVLLQTLKRAQWGLSKMILQFVEKVRNSRYVFFRLYGIKCRDQCWIAWIGGVR